MDYKQELQKLIDDKKIRLKEAKRFKDDKAVGLIVQWKDLYEIAKYFYELGYNSPKTIEVSIDIEKFICSLFEVKLTSEQKKSIEDRLRYVDAPYKFFMFKVINSLKEQGLEYKDGKIVELTTEE